MSKMTKANTISKCLLDLEYKGYPHITGTEYFIRVIQIDLIPSVLKKYDTIGNVCVLSVDRREVGVSRPCANLFRGV